MLPAADDSIQVAPNTRKRVSPGSLKRRHVSKSVEAVIAADGEARRPSVGTISEDAIDEGDDEVFALSPLDAMKFVDLVMMNRTRGKSPGPGDGIGVSARSGRSARVRSASVRVRSQVLLTAIYIDGDTRADVHRKGTGHIRSPMSDEH